MQLLQDGYFAGAVCSGVGAGAVVEGVGAAVEVPVVVTGFAGATAAGGCAPNSGSDLSTDW